MGYIAIPTAPWEMTRCSVTKGGQRLRWKHSRLCLALARLVLATYLESSVGAGRGRECLSVAVCSAVLNRSQCCPAVSYPKVLSAALSLDNRRGRRGGHGFDWSSPGVKRGSKGETPWVSLQGKVALATLGSSPTDRNCPIHSIGRFPRNLAPAFWPACLS